MSLDALNMGIWTREHAGADLADLIHHSDRGVQYTAIRYSERLADVEAVASVGSVGDSYDNAMAEALNSLFKGVDGRHMARCTVGRLMKDAGLRGVSRVKSPTTTRRGSGPDTRPDLVDRKFVATAPNQLWVADITYIRTFSGWVYASTSLRSN